MPAGTAPALGPGVVEGANTRQLHRLRRRMTLVYSTVAALGLSVLVAITLVTDARTRDASLDARLRGVALAAGRLVVVRDGRLEVSGLVNDRVYAHLDAVTVVEPGPPPRATPVLGVLDGDELGRQAWEGPAEDGSAVEDAVVDGRPARVVAAPFYSDDDGHVAGAVVVAQVVPAQSEADRRYLQLVVGVTGAGLVALVTATGWLYAGRQVRRLGGALDQQEAFLALAAHELRTPIGRSQAVAEGARLVVLQGDGEGMRRQLVEELDRLVAITQDASASIDDLLLLGRIRADRHGRRFAPVRLDELVGPFESIVPGTVVHAPGPVTVVGDDVLLRHLVQNLVGNARRHGRPGGGPRPPRIDVELERGAGERGRPEVTLTVSDDGPGFPPELLATAFDRFVGGGRGTGLGLWIVRWIAELHGGRATAGNRPGGGAVVRVTLPG